MAFLDCFEEEMITPVTIIGKGEITDFDSSGHPIYGSPVVKYSGLSGFGQLSANEQFIMDRINNPSTHKIIIDPAKILSKIVPSDYALVTVEGTEEEYDLYGGENALDEIYVITARIRR